MKKFVTLFVAASVLGLAACADTDTKADYSYETQAPYGDERTVGDEKTTTTQKADPIFNKSQRK